MMQHTKLCAVDAILDVLSAKWTTEILQELNEGPTRTRRFLLHIRGLTMKSLRQRLQVLERHGFVERHVLADRPLKVEYIMTDKGRELFSLIGHLEKLADKWGDPLFCTCASATARLSSVAK